MKQSSRGGGAHSFCFVGKYIKSSFEMKEKVTVLFLTESVHPRGLEKLCAGVA